MGGLGPIVQKRWTSESVDPLRRIFFPESRPHGLWKIEDSHIFNPNFFMTAKVAYYGTGFQLAPRGGNQPWIQDVSVWASTVPVNLPVQYQRAF